MPHIFISHAEEDASIAASLAKRLTKAGYSTWHYTEKNKVGDDYLEKIAGAIEKAGAIILILSPDSLRSFHVGKEVQSAIDQQKPFIPLRYNVTHEEFRKQRPGWSLGIGTTVSLELTRGRVAAAAAEVVSSLERLQLEEGPPQLPLPRSLWKRVLRELALRPARVKVAAALTTLAVAGLLLWLFLHPSKKVEIGKQAALFEMSYDGDENLVYVTRVKVNNYGPEEYPITDIRMRIETPAEAGSESYEFSSDGIDCFRGETDEKLHEYVVPPLGELKMRCVGKVKIIPEEGARRKQVLLREGVTQSLTLAFIWYDDQLIEELRFCFAPPGSWPFSARYTDVCEWRHQ